MRKIPTLFVRDENDRAHVTEQVTPGCEWVLAGEGVATRKYDGTCVAFDGREWTMGWEPVAQSSFAKFHAEALEYALPIAPAAEVVTYELIGPKINGNPEGVSHHMLVRHSDAQTFGSSGVPRVHKDLRTLVQALAKDGWEGLVWHHPDGRMAKLKARDFPTS